MGARNTLKGPALLDARKSSHLGRSWTGKSKPEGVSQVLMGPICESAQRYPHRTSLVGVLKHTFSISECDNYSDTYYTSRPPQMESLPNLMYMGVFDGHGGTEAATFAKERLHEHLQGEGWMPTLSFFQLRTSA